MTFAFLSGNPSQIPQEMGVSEQVLSNWLIEPIAFPG
jgi:hypothetical protein